MAERLTSTEFTDGQGTHRYIIEILDDDYVGTVQEMTLTAAALTWRPRKQDRYAAVIPSSLKFTILRNPIEAEVTALVNDMVDATEERFQVRVTRNGLSYWIGYMLIENIEYGVEPLENKPTFTIKAVDGLARMKDIEYNPGGTLYTGKESLKDHLINCINAINLAQYTTATAVLQTAMNWVEDQMNASAAPAIQKVRINHRVFLNTDGSGAILSLSVLEVLEELCRRFGARFFFDQGLYKFHQVHDIGRAAGFPELATFFKNGNLAGVPGTDQVFEKVMRTAATQSSTDLQQLAGGKIGFLPPLQFFKETYKHFQSVQAWTFGPLLDGEENSAGGNTRGLEIDDLNSNSGTARLWYQGLFTMPTFNVTGGETYPLWLVLRFRCLVDDYYLERTATINDAGTTPANGYVTYDTPAWVQVVDPDTDIRYYELAFELRGDGLRQFSLDFTTPGVPVDGNLFFHLWEYEVKDHTNTVTVQYIADWHVYGSRLNVIYDSAPTDAYNTSQYKISADAGGNSKRFELETRIGDGPNPNVFGALEVDDGTSWVPSSSQWKDGGTADPLVSIHQLLSETVYKGQVKPCRVWKGPFLGNYNPTDRIDYDGAYLAFQQGTLDMKNGQWREVNAFEIKEDPDATTFEVLEFEQEVGSGTPPPGGTPTPGPDPPDEPSGPGENTNPGSGSADGVVTSASMNGTDLVLTRSEGLPDLTVENVDTWLDDKLAAGNVSITAVTSNYTLDLENYTVITDEELILDGRGDSGNNDFYGVTIKSKAFGLGLTGRVQFETDWLHLRRGSGEAIIAIQVPQTQPGDDSLLTASSGTTVDGENWKAASFKLAKWVNSGSFTGNNLELGTRDGGTIVIDAGKAVPRKVTLTKTTNADGRILVNSIELGSPPSIGPAYNVIQHEGDDSTAPTNLYICYEFFPVVGGYHLYWANLATGAKLVSTSVTFDIIFST